MQRRPGLALPNAVPNGSAGPRTLQRLSRPAWMMLVLVILGSNAPDGHAQILAIGGSTVMEGGTTDRHVATLIDSNNHFTPVIPQSWSVTPATYVSLDNAGNVLS